jgi:hypothetical protein
MKKADASIFLKLKLTRYPQPRLRPNDRESLCFSTDGLKSSLPTKVKWPKMSFGSEVDEFLAVRQFASEVSHQSYGSRRAGEYLHVGHKSANRTEDNEQTTSSHLRLKIAEDSANRLERHDAVHTAYQWRSGFRSGSTWWRAKRTDSLLTGFCATHM